jgi:hypothetical protein
MKQLTVKLSLILVTTLITGCTNFIAPVDTIHKAPAKSEDFTTLDREYLQFKTKSLTDSYIERKMRVFLTEPVRAVNVVKEIAYARVKHPVEFRNMVLAHQELYEALIILPEVEDRRGADALFDQYISSLKAEDGGSVDLEAGLVAYYPFNNSPEDMSPLGLNDGTIVNPSGVTPAPDRFGTMDKAYDFNGTGYISVPHHDSQNGSTPDMTISYWMNTRALNGVRIIISKIRQESREEGWASLIIDGYTMWHLRPGYVCCYNITFGNEPDPTPTNTWLQVISVVDGTVMKQYIKSMNNPNVHFTSYDFTPLVNTKGNQIINIGRSENIHGDYFDGLIDDLRIYDRALNEAEVNALYAQEIQPPG